MAREKDKDETQGREAEGSSPKTDRRNEPARMREGPVAEGTGTGTESEVHDAPAADTSREGVARALGVSPDDPRPNEGWREDFGPEGAGEVSAEEDVGSMGQTGVEEVDLEKRTAGRRASEAHEDEPRGKRAA